MAVPSTVRQSLTSLARRYAPTLLYPRPKLSALAPERLYAYLDAIWQRRELDGAIVEVGSWLGGTAALAYRLLANTGFDKRYVCVDTFGGFVADQFDRDVAHGTASGRRLDFSGNSLETVSRLMRHWGCEGIELVQGDIATVADERLPERVSVALVDVDLEVPVYEGLRRMHPRLVPGGTILVDDCPPGHNWPGARIGYSRFVSEHDLPERYFMGMGVVDAPARASSVQLEASAAEQLG
ncbi:MAG: class I SAM-dependent methyltransferase [Actinomycetota bacterium]|nr:class I SAM-dependent methyltransferase [Actinomycetota bacterium]